MNKQQAIDLVKQTFESAFDKSRFSKFIRELLNEANFDASFSHRGQYIYGDFEKDVSLFERIAKYSDGENEIDILIVHLKKDLSIERARTMQRNFIAKYLNSKDRSAALVAFVSPNPEDWRFSLVKMEYGFKERPDGTPKAVTEFTPAKRWSFLVGSHEKSHTAQRQFQPILADSENNPTLEILEEAFNIEKVTKEFFEKYRDLFIRAKGELDQAVAANPKTKADFESKGIDTTNLAKKLLGQIIFLYFLQKKGWFGVPRDAAWGEGSRNFLRELFDKKHSDYKNFFNDILEPLFYEALRIDRSHDDHYYSRFNCKIPFLNGGLFDPMGGYDWVHTDILLPDNLFSNKTKTKEGDEGDGILDAFDRYNFTVKEDEPFEKEVAIDPELLGKAYEKFNAIRPDNYDEFLKALKSGKKGEESKFNKQYGVYYTPREIVHYMCQQSLINYLDSELNPNVVYQKLGDENLDMFGNATKEGQLDLTVEHHPMAEIPKEAIALLIQHGESLREHEAQAAEKETRTYSPIISEAIRKNAARIDQKLAGIKICDPAVGSGAFPVGMMSEIVKARQTLAVYRQTSEVSETSEVLSAYRFKRACIENSLYGVDIDAGAVEIAKLRLWLSLIVEEDNIQNIKPLPNLDYKIVQGNSLIEILTEDFLVGDSDAEKTKFLNQLKNAKEELFNLTSPSQKEQKRREIEGLMQALFENYRDRQIRKLKEQLQGHKGSVRLVGFSDSKTLKSEQTIVQAIEEQIKGFQGLGLPDKTEHFEWHIIFSEVFQKSGGGFDIVIANPPYIDSERMVGEGQLALRKTIAKTYKLTKGNWDIYIAFFEKGFNLLNSKGTLAFITPDKWISKPFGDALRISKLANFLAILKAGREIFEDAKVDAIVSLFSNIKQEYIDVYLYETEIILKDRVQKKELNSPYTLDALFSSGLELIQKIDDTEDRLSDNFLCENACATSDAYKLKPFVRENKSDTLNSAAFFKVVNTGTIGKYFSKWAVRPMVYLGDDYLCPIIKRDEFFKNFKNSYSNKILRPKLIMKGLNLLDAFLDDDGTTLPGKTTLVITNKDNNQDELIFLLAVINSSLIFYYIKEKYSSSSYNQGTTFTKDMINGIPFPKIDGNIRKKIVSTVARVLAAKHGNPQADTSALEKEIDQLVYQLYGLTDEEIKIIEGQD